MKDLITLLEKEFESDIEKNGLFWRLARPNTFIDLLMLESYKINTEGFSYDSYVNVILLTFKGIINMTHKVIEPSLDFDKIINELNLEVEKIKAAFVFYVEEAQEKNNKRIGQGSSISNEINYFKILNNLEIDNYSVDIFEKTFYFFVSKMTEIKHLWKMGGTP